MFVFFCVEQQALTADAERKQTTDFVLFMLRALIMMIMGKITTIRNQSKNTISKSNKTRYRNNVKWYPKIDKQYTDLQRHCGDRQHRHTNETCKKTDCITNPASVLPFSLYKVTSQQDCTPKPMQSIIES